MSDGVKKPAQWVAAWLGIATTTLKDVSKRAGLDSEDGYDILKVVPVVVDYYRKMSEEADQSVKQDKARKAKAEADVAEIEAAKSRGEIMLVSDQRDAWADLVIEARRTTEEASYIPQKSRERLVKKLLAIKLGPDAG